MVVVLFWHGACLGKVSEGFNPKVEERSGPKVVSGTATSVDYLSRRRASLELFPVLSGIRKAHLFMEQGLTFRTQRLSTSHHS